MIQTISWNCTHLEARWVIHLANRFCFLLWLIKMQTMLTTACHVLSVCGIGWTGQDFMKPLSKFMPWAIKSPVGN